jgi:hypothetical protein
MEALTLFGKFVCIEHGTPEDATLAPVEAQLCCRRSPLTGPTETSVCLARHRLWALDVTRELADISASSETQFRNFNSPAAGELRSLHDIDIFIDFPTTD